MGWYSEESEKDVRRKAAMEVARVIKGEKTAPRGVANMDDETKRRPSEWGSSRYLTRPTWSNVRSLYKSMGYTDHDLERPLIGIANSWNRATPGHYNLNAVSEYVKQGILQAGGTPVEFGIIGPCDGMGVGNAGGDAVLSARQGRDRQRDRGDGPGEQPGRHRAARFMRQDRPRPPDGRPARIDIPAIVVNGGPMLGGVVFDGRESDNSTLSEALGMLQKGLITREEYDKLEDDSMPCCGSCSFLGTANTMGAFTEALGMCPPGDIPDSGGDGGQVSRRPGIRPTNRRHGRRGPARAEHNHEGETSKTRSVLELAIGGSTNLVLPLPRDSL